MLHFEILQTTYLEIEAKCKFQIFIWIFKILDAKFGLHNYVLKKIHFRFNCEINEFAIKPIASRFSLLHHRTMEIWIFQPNAAQG